MLSAPKVIPPLTPCSTHIRVQWLLPGATVRILADGREVAKKDRVASSEELIELPLYTRLKPGAMVLAEQSLDGDASGIPPFDLAVKVLKHPDSDDLDDLYAPFPLLQCATCLFVGGTIPGATVSLDLNGGPPFPSSRMMSSLILSLLTVRNSTPAIEWRCRRLLAACSATACSCLRPCR
jgi:hypothetical protein